MRSSDSLATIGRGSGCPLRCDLPPSAVEWWGPPRCLGRPLAACRDS